MNKKKNLTTKEIFTLAVQNHQKNNLKVAKKLYEEILRINPNHFVSIFLFLKLISDFFIASIINCSLQ